LPSPLVIWLDTGSNTAKENTGSPPSSTARVTPSVTEGMLRASVGGAIWLTFMNRRIPLPPMNTSDARSMVENFPIPSTSRFPGFFPRGSICS